MQGPRARPAPSPAAPPRRWSQLALPTLHLHSRLRLRGLSTAARPSRWAGQGDGSRGGDCAGTRARSESQSQSQSQNLSRSTSGRHAASRRPSALAGSGAAAKPSPARPPPPRERSVPKPTAKPLPEAPPRERAEPGRAPSPAARATGTAHLGDHGPAHQRGHAPGVSSAGAIGCAGEPVSWESASHPHLARRAARPVSLSTEWGREHFAGTRRASSAIGSAPLQLHPAPHLGTASVPNPRRA